MRFQNNTQNCEARKGHLGDETSPILPTSPILVPFALVSRAAMGEGVGSRPHDGPRPPSVRSSHPVSIEMPDSLIEELPRDVSRLASLVLHSAGKQPRPRRLRRCRQTGGPTAVRHMTHLGEPQSAAGVPALVPDHRADQPRLARMGALLKEIRCQFTIQGNPVSGIPHAVHLLAKRNRYRITRDTDPKEN